jgi:hypothetical protein
VKSEWRVTTNIIDGKTVYGVYRIIDVGEVDHSGNREMAGEYISCREAAQSIAEVLNEMEMGEG